jgi:P27 family predicted phage terminase small subunit
LSDDARGCIDIIKQSIPSNVYSTLDSFLLSAFAMAWTTHKRAAHEIGAPGFQWMTASKRGGPQASPWIRIANQQAGILAALGDRLGLDPKSRAALKLPDAKQRKSKFAGLKGASSPTTTYRRASPASSRPRTLISRRFG